MNQELSKIPLLTDFNRVERAYPGGKLLDEWQGLLKQTGLSTAADSQMSEEFLVSTTKYIGPGNPPENGLSMVLAPGNNRKNLFNLINDEPEAFLGSRYAGLCHGQAGVQLRVGDSIRRLIIQCHPDNEKARTCFKIPFGKTEAWYIANTREINGEKAHVYCGFKPGITKEKWRELFQADDAAGMLDCLHRFEVKTGDCIIIKAGTPHAIGSGCLFVELHQPCDITLRMERNYSPKPLTDEQMHNGPGFDVLFDCFDYTGRDREQTIADIFMRPVEETVLEEGTIYSMIGYDITTEFCMKKIHVNGRVSLPPFDGHYLLTPVKGSAALEYDGGVLNAPQGRGVFVPASCRKLKAAGNAEIILAYPFLV